jgi:coenzyme PQQ precursor peptide PqqA
MGAAAAGPQTATRGTDWKRRRRRPVVSRPAPRTPRLKEPPMKWEKPAATDMRFGFEITLYIANR